MRIESIHIEGFGIFRDLRLDELSPGLTVIHGDNESGKSTLLNFVRSLFFGFPSSRTKEQQYPPLRGGVLGGRIVLSDDGGKRYVIERIRTGKSGSGKVTVTLPDGAKGGEDSLSEIISPADKALFESVFAFSLDELYRFESLSQDRVKSAIFSAAMGLGSISLSEVERRLKERMHGLFRPSGAKQVINVLLNEMKELEGKIESIEAEIGKYDQLRIELSEVRKKLSAAKRERDERAKAIEHKNTLLQAWSDFNGLEFDKEELGKLEPITSFPAKGSERFSKLKEKLEDRKRSFEELVEGRKAKENELKALDFDESLLANADKIEKVQAGGTHYEKAVADLPVRKSELEAAEEGLSELLSGLGRDWDEDRLEGFDTSIVAREKIQAFGKSLDEATKLVLLHEKGVNDLAKELKAAKEKESGYKEELEGTARPERTDLTEIQRLRRSIGRVRAHLNSIAFKKKDLVSLESRLESEKVRRSLAAKLGVAPTFGWLGMAVAAIGVILGVVIGVTSGAAQGAISGGIVLISGAVLQLYLRRQEARRLEEAVPTADYDKRIVELEVQIQSLRKEIEDDTANLPELAEEVGLKGAIDEPRLREEEERLEQQELNLRAWEKLAVELDRAEEARRKLEAALKEEQERLAEAKTEKASVEEDWGGWLTGVGLDAGLDPAAAREALSLVMRARDMVRSKRNLKDRIETMEETISEYRRSVEALIESSRLQKLKDTEAAVDALGRELKRAREASRDAQSLEKLIRETREKESRLKKEIQKLEKEMADLLRRGGAKDENEFLAREEIYQKRQKLEESISDREKRLRELLGRGDAFEAAKKELQATTQGELRQKVEALERERAELNEEIEAQSKREGELKAELERIASREDLNEIRMKLELARSQAADAAKKWSSFAVTALLLEKARKKYEEERQPEVIKEAESFFSEITDGRYKGVFVPLDEDSIEVIAEDDSRLDHTKLSRGTAEQLYLALRFGYIRSLGKGRTAYPVIADEILVNFDPGRAQAAVKGLRQLSKTHQVILFTCHPGTVKLVRKVEPRVRIVHLADGALKE